MKDNKNRLFEIMNKVTGMKMINEDINRDSMYNGQQMQVKIIKCDNPMYWYANYIGQTITVVPDDSRTNWSDGKEKWKVVPDNNLRGVNYVNKEDCQPINGGINETDENGGSDIHLVDDLYSSDFIGKKMKYGSPGYPMTFIPREITEKGNGEFEFTGDMPGATIGTEGHYFTISENELEELELNGEVSWIGPDGAHLYLSF